jgi:protein phosphatase
MAIVVRWGARSDTGRVRELNEDSLLADPPLFVVADGVGGHAAGEVASGLAVARLAGFTGSPAVDAVSVLQAVRDANHHIRQRAAEVSSDRGMGSTIVGVALSWLGARDVLLVFNVGDSRAFRFTEGSLAQVSEDHSLVDELLRSGQITAEEALVHPCRSVITRALGAADDVEVDSWPLDAQAGDRFLLCSDGLTNEVPFAMLEQVLAETPDPDEVARRLVHAALENGGRDNVTVVVVDVVEVVQPDAPIQPEAPADGNAAAALTVTTPLPATVGTEPGTDDAALPWVEDRSTARPDSGETGAAEPRRRSLLRRLRG